PASAPIERMVASALRQADDTLSVKIAARLPPPVATARHSAMSRCGRRPGEVYGTDRLRPPAGQGTRGSPARRARTERHRGGLLRSPTPAERERRIVAEA